MAVTTRRQSKEAWFRRGAHAISCVVSPSPPKDAYLCPLCLNFFTIQQLRAGDVTDEHVPPSAVGGKALVLTCKACNSVSSGMCDGPMASEERMRTFGQTYSLGPLPASVTVDGSRMNGSLDFDGQRFNMQGLPDQNSPGRMEEHEAALDQLAPGQSLTVEIRMRGWPARARLGWMRSAYLAAFAVYGYRYILQPAFAPLRDALRDLSGGHFEPVVLKLAHEGPLDPLIAEVNGPVPFAGCRAAVFGPRLILLPPSLAPADWFATLEQRLLANSPEGLDLASVIGRRFPHGPMHLTDG